MPKNGTEELFLSVSKNALPLFNKLKNRPKNHIISAIQTMITFSFTPPLNLGSICEPWLVRLTSYKGYYSVFNLPEETLKV